MAKPFISMRQNGIAEAKSKLSRMQRKITDLTPVLKVGARDIETLMATSFELEEDPGGTKWSELADSTIESRSRRGAAAKKRDKSGKLTKSAEKLRAKRKAVGGTKKLVITGRLKNSMFARAKKSSIQFGSNVDYLAPHQVGGENKNPPRRMIAPVEKRGPNWALIRRGRAKEVFDRLEKSIGKHVTLA